MYVFSRNLKNIYITLQNVHMSKLLCNNNTLIKVRINKNFIWQTV